MTTGPFIEMQRRRLLYRRETKMNILRRGGQQALSHSPHDITRIDFALRRIQEKQYGLCANCGIHIDKNRLKVIPETPFCASCAKSIEAQ